MTTKRFVLPVAAGCVAAGLSVVGVAPAASAEVTGQQAVDALDLGGTDVTAVVAGSAATTTEVFNDFPSAFPGPANTSYLMLSTGDASQVFGSDPDAQLSSDLPGTDASTLTLTVPPAAGRGCLYVDFAMGTEEPVHTYTANVPGDTLSIKRAGDETEYAMGAGRGYFQQENWLEQPTPYTPNAMDYWHQPGDPEDPIPSSTNEPRLPEVTGLNNVTTRDTARIPLGGGTETITISIEDVNNDDLDSVAFVDRVRFGTSCGTGTGVELVHGSGVDSPIIGGIKGVGNELFYDPIPSTPEVERYNAPGLLANGWRSPSNTPVELRFRWYRALSGNNHNGDMRNWTAIPDADRQSYIPTAVDKGKVLIVLVTGVVDGRRYETFPSTGTAATWYVTDVIGNGTFTNVPKPTITPSAGVHVGDVLAAQTAAATPRQGTYAFQWFANGMLLNGQNAQTFEVGPDEAGDRITVKVTAKRENFNDSSQTSDPTDPVLFEQWSQVGTPSIVDDGTPMVGETVTAEPGSWAPQPDSYSYQWLRNGSVIVGATLPTYTLKAEDAGAVIKVRLSGIEPGYAQSPQTSPGITVAGSTMIGAEPIISGEVRVGKVLTGTVTDWDPIGSSLTYAWLVNGTVVQQGVGRTFQVPPSAAGKVIVLEVTGKRAGYTTLTRASEPTPAVLKGILTTSTPTINGTPAVGQTLYASAGPWGPYGVKLTYRWKIGGVAVTGRAGSQSYFKIPRSARGKRITVMVTGKLLGYATKKKTSAPTASVKR